MRRLTKPKEVLLLRREPFVEPSASTESNSDGSVIGKVKETFTSLLTPLAVATGLTLSNSGAMASDQVTLQAPQEQNVPVEVAAPFAESRQWQVANYALPPSQFLIGTESTVPPPAVTMEISGIDANSAGLDGFKAWVSKFILHKSTGLDWGTLQELHGLYQEALAGSVEHLSLMQVASHAVLGEQNGIYHKLKFLNDQNQTVAELLYTDEGELTLRPSEQENFYAVEEMRAPLQADWVKQVPNVRASADGRLILKKNVTAANFQLAVNNIVAQLQKLHPQASTHIRMGNHEFGIQLSGITRRFQTGNLHIHIEFTLPNEQKIVSYMLPVDANSLTANQSISTADLTAKYKEVFQPLISNVNWPSTYHVQTLAGNMSVPADNTPGTDLNALPLFFAQEDLAFIAEQLKSSTSNRVSEGDKTILQAVMEGLPGGFQYLSHALQDILARTQPAVLLLGPDSPSEAELLGSLANSFPMIGYKGSSLKDNLSLLRPNQENMIFLYSHGHILNDRNFRNRAWNTELFSQYDEVISMATLDEIIRASRQYNSGFTHLLIWTCYAGQTLEDYMKLLRAHPRIADNMNLYVPSGVYELRTNEVDFYNRQPATSYFSDILDRMSYYIHNGETSTLAQKVVVRGTVVEPLAISIQQLKDIVKQTKGAPSLAGAIQRYKALLADMQALRDIALARTGRSFKKALLAYAALHPGYVKVGGQNYEDVVNEIEAPHNYIWSNKEEILADFTDIEPKTALILLDPSVTSYVSSVAQVEYMKLKFRTPPFIRPE